MSDISDVFSATDAQMSHPNAAAALRLILHDYVIDKLELPGGIPGTMDELQSIVQQKYGLEPGKFTLHYRDADYEWGVC